VIIGSVEANYFTPTQQQLIRDFVDRRGGGCSHGRARTLLRRRLPASPLADLGAHQPAEGKGTFHRDFTARNSPPPAPRACCAGWMRTRAQPRALEEDAEMANYQEAGDPKPGATVLLVSTPAGRRKPLCW